MCVYIYIYMYDFRLYITINNKFYFFVNVGINEKDHFYKCVAQQLAEVKDYKEKLERPLWEVRMNDQFISEKIYRMEIKVEDLKSG